MSGFSLLSFVWLLVAPMLCWGHGKLTRPTPRDGISVGRAGLDENNPVSFEPGCNGPMNKCDAFVCREPSPNSNVPITQVTAGGSLQLEWSFAAFHVGDCAAYISYDADLPRSQQKYVKIANLPDCKSYASSNIQIPAGLPAGRAILRWDWAALHIWPTVEFYVQCVDIQISSSSTSSPAELNSYPIKNVYPDDGNDGVGYRNGFNSNMPQDMTGPSCFDGSINQCALTAPGTLRNTDSRRGSLVPAPAPTSTAALAPASTTTRVPTTSLTTSLVPTVAPVACIPVGDCGGFSWCDQPLYEQWCASQGNACRAPFCKGSSSPSPAPAPTPVPAPSPAPTTSLPVPSPSSSSSCRASLTGLYMDASIWEPWCASAFTAGSCPSPMCAQATSLLSKARRHNFLGTALLQSGADVERAMTSADEL